jgi:signal transduction histidine kinase
VLEEAAAVRSPDGPAVDTRAVSAGPVWGDRDALSRIVRNLLSNAVAHARSRVTVALETAADQVTVTVDDDGPGIPAGDRERVFERFVRLEPDRGAGSGGTGLGLAIARGLAERHGGAVEATDPPAGVGARLILRLPSVLPASAAFDRSDVANTTSPGRLDDTSDGYRAPLWPPSSTTDGLDPSASPPR